MDGDGKLRELDQGAIARLDVDFLTGKVRADVEDYEEPFGGGREVDLTEARAVIEEGMRRFDAGKRAQSDRWIGPRLHAALRLTRREAARRGVWRYLGVCEFSDYIRWRFKGDKDDPEAPAKIERFVGPDYKQGLARLWWMAEMFRNGPDYEPAVRALAIQDVVNNLFRNDTAHHRPTALGAIGVLSPGEGPERSGDEANALAKAVNATAATVLLDAFAPDVPLDDDARERWIEEAGDHDAGLFFDELPIGPDDPPAPADGVERMVEMLGELLAEAPVRDRGDKRSAETTAAAA